MVSNTSTRRGMLGAMAVAPALAALPVSAIAASPASTWDATMARYLKAQAASDTEWAVFKRRKGGNTPKQTKYMDELSQLASELHTDLLEMPAPHLAAVQWKLEYLLHIEADGYTGSYHRDLITPVMNDVRRLAATGSLTLA